MKGKKGGVNGGSFKGCVKYFTLYLYYTKIVAFLPF